MPFTQQLSSLKEERAHGSQSFRCGCYHTDPQADRFLVPPHWHDELEIIYFRKGNFTLEIDMERYQISSECLFFINSGELHRILCMEQCQESAVVFSPYLLAFISNDAAQSRLTGPLSRRELLLPRQITPAQNGYSDILCEYQKLIRSFDQENVNTLPAEARQLFVKAALLNILGLLAANGMLLTARKSRNENVEGIKTVLSYIHTHYTEKIFVSELAGLLNLNEQYFCRLFKKAIGQSPIAYTNEYRIRRAIDLLGNTALPVTDICLECGFNNFGNFLREFRKHTGTTPLQFRLNLQKVKIT